MDIALYLEMLYNDCSNPCCFSDFETEELVFVNQAMEKKFQIFEDYTGIKYFEFFKKSIDLGGYHPKNGLSFGGFVEKRIFSTTLNSYLRANTTIIDVLGQKLIMTKYFLTSVDKNRAEATHSFESAMTKCLEILTYPDQTTSIQAFLKLLCEFYSCELAYICEFDRYENTLANRYFWKSGEGEIDIPKRKDTVSIEHFLEWLDNDSERDLIHLDNFAKDYELNTTGADILDKYNISNITLNKLWNRDGTLMGIVGMSNRSQPIYDDRLLKAISHFVIERFSEQSMVKALTSLHEMDLLTGFYNRTKYAEKLSELHHNPTKTLGVLFVNLNGLRKTNEYFGFEVGDVQIKKTSKLLREFFLEDFYRISGDEFVGFIENSDKSTFEFKVDKLQKRLQEQNHEASFSLGHSWDSGNYQVTNLVKMADTMMVINKQAYYFSTLKDTEEITNTILQDLFRAIAEEEFLIYLQPQIDLSTRRIVGAEALIRRFDERRNKLVFPDHFIPLYEKKSLIRHVDLFVVRKVCQMLQEWRLHGQELPISVNLSRVTLMEYGIVRIISDILDEYAVPHHLIVIEVTERIGLVENDVASSLVDEFKAQGFKLSLDDFGCAYSNIVTLSQIDVDEVKIDKSLVDNLISNPKNRVIVKNMLLMCNELENTYTLAEGIETEEQAEFLHSVHCHLGQGYLYSRPIPNEEFFEKYMCTST